MATVMSIDPLEERLAAFGAAVHTVNGHDFDALAAPAATEHPGKPLVVLAKTDPCRDMPLLRERIPKLHYVRFKSESERDAYEQRLAELSEPRKGG